MRAFTGAQHPRNPLFLSLLLPHPRAPCSGAAQRTAALSQLPAEPPAPRHLHEPRTKRGGRGAVTAGAPLPAAARLQPPGLPPPQSERDEASPRPFPRAQGPAASLWRRQDPPQPNGRPTAAQRSPNGRRARSLRSPPRPPDGAARAASARPATRCVTAHGPASPHPPSLPRSPRAAPPQGGACAGRGLCPCTTPPCWGGGLRARTRGVEGALRGPGRLCGWGWDWMVLRAPSSPSPSLKSRSYSRKHLL